MIESIIKEIYVYSNSICTNNDKEINLIFNDLSNEKYLYFDDTMYKVELLNEEEIYNKYKNNGGKDIINNLKTFITNLDRYNNEDIYLVYNEICCLKCMKKSLDYIINYIKNKYH